MSQRNEKEGRRSKLRAIAEWSGISLAALLLCLLVVVLYAGLTAPDFRQLRTAGGGREDVSFYLQMPDGVRLAVDAYLPPSYKGGRLPTLVYMTRYWRTFQFSFMGKALVHLGLIPHRPGPDDVFAPYFLDANFAIVAVDSRGTGASDGQWSLPFGPKEISDFNTVFDWVIKQPWSNGNIGTYGISYPGFTAELAATDHNPALKAVAPLFVYWDMSRDVLEPGGVLDKWLVAEWSAFTAGLDRGDPCAIEGLGCKLRSLLFTGVKPVDSDESGQELSRILRERHNESFLDGVKSYEFRGDKYSGTGLSIDDVTPAAFATQLAQSGVAYYVMAGYYDSDGVSSVIRRFIDQSNAQDVLIGPWSHGGRWNADPFLTPRSRPSMSLKQVTERMVEFFDKHLRAPLPVQPTQGHRIAYYVNGAGLWRTTTQWPPPGHPLVRWYFRGNRALARQPSSSPAGADRYAVNFAATSGAQPRYHTTIEGRPIVYAERAAEDLLDLTYTSAAMSADTEIAGTPAVHLEMSSSTSDGVVYVYLEDVAPSGRVTYLTEGNLRLIDRAVSDPQHLGGALGPQHGFSRSDAESMPAGLTVPVDVALEPISAVIREGHRLRISIAGYDASSFPRVPARGDPTFMFERNRSEASYADIPMTRFESASGLAQPPAPE